MKFTTETMHELIELGNSKNVFLEGNIIKVIENTEEDFQEYLRTALQKDEEKRKKRLDVTKQVQDQNKELIQKQAENDSLMKEIKQALDVAEKAKEEALNDLSVAQQKTQFELIGNIVNIALLVIVSVGVIVTGMYVYSMMIESGETTLIGNTWSNLFGILLTNSFSIIGTIMGVKHAQASTEKKEAKK